MELTCSKPEGHAVVIRREVATWVRIIEEFNIEDN
jgi:hypothetical protein